MKSQPRDPFLLAATMVALVLSCIGTHADTIFVWSDDSTIRQFTTTGVGSLFASNSWISGWNGPVGLTVDNEDNLYSGCPGTSRVLKYSTNGIGTEVGFADSVSAVAFDRTGNIYLTSPNYHSLCKGYFTVNCTQLHLSYPTGLAFDSAGNIYVANGVYPHPYGPAYTNTIGKFAPDLTYLGDFAAGLNRPWGLAFDQAGNLYVANSGTNGFLNNTIAVITPDGGGSIYVSSGLNSPRGLAFDRAGNLYVANCGDGTIRKIAPGGAGSVFATGLNSPTSIAIQPGLKLWPTSITLINSMVLPDGAFQFAFDNTPGMSFSVLGTTHALLPSSNWSVLGSVTETSVGEYHFTDTQAMNWPQRFYRVSSD